MESSASQADSSPSGSQAADRFDSDRTVQATGTCAGRVRSTASVIARSISRSIVSGHQLLHLDTRPTAPTSDVWSEVTGEQ
jgi:hypothetical protein